MIDTNDLEVKLELYASFIVNEIIVFDSLARRQWFFTYKGVIQYCDTHGSELTQEHMIGADLYRDLINKVEDLIKHRDDFLLPDEFIKC